MIDLSPIRRDARALYVVGDVLDRLSELPDDSVDLVVTSPPFLALRSYLPSDHPDKSKEIGAEPTPAVFIDSLLDVVEALERVLTPTGSLVFELGDTYSGSGGGGGDYLEGGLRDGQQVFSGSASSMRESNAAHWRQKNGWKTDGRTYTQRQSRAGRQMAGPAPEEWGMDPASEGKGRGRQARVQRTSDVEGWPEAKSLCMIPESFRWALSYGMNPFNGRQTPPWKVRNVVRWWRPNPPVGELGDKFRPATSDLAVACKSRLRYFDQDAVRTVKERQQERYVGRRRSHGGDMDRPDEGASPQNPGGAPLQDTWIIPTKPYRGSHYAVFPPELVTPFILSMCPERVCIYCGEPSRRIVEQVEPDYVRHSQVTVPGGEGGDFRATGGMGRRIEMANRSVQTVGWTECDCLVCPESAKWRPGIVLDPFGGSGTVGMVATGHGRSCLMIDLDQRNVELARERVGMFLIEEEDE